MRPSHRLRANEDDDFPIRTIQELLNALNSTSQLLTVLLTAIAGISLVIGITCSMSCKNITRCVK